MNSSTAKSTSVTISTLESLSSILKVSRVESEEVVVVVDDDDDEDDG